jgi:hypothetical protein
MEAMAECMADYFVVHHATMPGSGKALQAVDTTGSLEECAHRSYHDT